MSHRFNVEDTERNTIYVKELSLAYSLLTVA